MPQRFSAHPIQPFPGQSRKLAFLGKVENTVARFSTVNKGTWTPGPQGFEGASSRFPRRREAFHGAGGTILWQRDEFLLIEGATASEALDQPTSRAIQRSFVKESEDRCERGEFRGAAQGTLG